MRRPGTPRGPKPLLLRLRPWILPAIAAVLCVQLFLGGFDLGTVHDQLEAGEIDAALFELSRAKPGDLAAELTTFGGFSWYPAEQRAADLAALRDTPRENLNESPDFPTFVAPLRRFREPPRTARLREGLPQAVVLEISNLELGLPAERVELEPDQREVTLQATMLRGTSFVLQLQDPASLTYLPAIDGFEIVSGSEAQALGLAFDTATTHIAVDEPSEQLVAAIVALNHGLVEEALGHLDALVSRAAYETVARELTALALVSAGLDLSALRVLDGAPRP